MHWLNKQPFKKLFIYELRCTSIQHADYIRGADETRKKRAIWITSVFINMIYHLAPSDKEGV